MMRKGLAYLGFLMVLSVAACGQQNAGQQPAPAQPQSPGTAPAPAPAPSGMAVFKIGFVDDQSGPAAESGNDSKNSFLLAVEEQNRRGGVAGRKVEAVIYDDKADATQAATFVTRLIADDKVLAIVGGNPAVPAGASIPLVEQGKTPYVILAAATASFTDPVKPYVFRLGPTNDQDAGAIAEFVVKGGYKRPALIHNTLPFGLDGARAVEAALKKAGVPLVAAEAYETNAPEVTAQVVKVKAANPDVLIVWPYPADGAKVMRTTRQQGLNLPTVVARIGLYDSFRKLSGDAAEGVYVPNTVDLQRADVQEFMRKFTAKNGDRPSNLFVAIGYDAANLVFKAAENPNVKAALDQGDLAAARNALRDALEQLGEFKGLQGRPNEAFRFSPTNHQGPNSGWFTWYQIRGGRLVRADLAWAK